MGVTLAEPSFLFKVRRRPIFINGASCELVRNVENALTNLQPRWTPKYEAKIDPHSCKKSRSIFPLRSFQTTSFHATDVSCSAIICAPRWGRENHSVVLRVMDFPKLGKEEGRADDHRGMIHGWYLSCIFHWRASGLEEGCLLPQIDTYCL